MSDPEPDYTKLTLFDLGDVARHIDRNVYPERHERVLAEIARRKEKGESPARPRRPLSQGMKLFWRMVFLIAAINFATLLMHNQRIGGEALNGRQEGNRYYLFDKTYPGQYRQVSREVWLYSAIHSWSVLITHPLAILGVMAADPRPTDP